MMTRSDERHKGRGMRILVTGGAGFIGSHLVEALVARGDEVTVIDNLATAQASSLAAVEKQIRFHEASIADPSAVAKAFSEGRPQVVIHAAASYKDPDAWVEDIRTNVEGTANVVHASLDGDVGRLIYFQTALCYGNRPTEQPVTLSHPLAPESSYAVSKTAGENYIGLSGLPFVSFRLANVYGPRNVSGPIPTFWQRLSEGKSCFAVNTRRDFVFVGDIPKVVLQAIDGGGAGGYYHLSSGSDYSIKELYDEVAAALEIDRPVEERERGEDDAYTILLDPSRTEQEFGWRVATPLAEGVRQAVVWYGDHGVEETYTHLRLKD
jgi:UDP-glucose 4-epimerase